MRVMHIITPSHVSGAELHTIAVAKEMQRRGIATVIVTKPQPAFVEAARLAGIDTVVAPVSGKLNPRAAAAVMREIRRFRPDIVATSNTSASLWGGIGARASRTPCVAMVHGIGSAFCYRFAPACICVSRATADAMAARGLPVDRLRVVHNGIDPAPFQGGPAADVPAPPGVPCVGTVAHLSEKKGMRELVAVAERVPEAHFVVVGDGVMRPWLETASRDVLGGRLHLLGFRRDIPALMRRFDVFCLPSHCEPFGLVYLEAMAAGRPVVAFASGGTPEVVADGETGLLAPPLDAAAMAACVRELTADPDRAVAMGRAGRERVLERFTTERSVDRLLEVYAAEIARQRGNPAA